MGRVAFKDFWAPKDMWLGTGFSGRDDEFLTEITKLILWIEDIYMELKTNSCVTGVILTFIAISLKLNGLERTLIHL